MFSDHFPAVRARHQRHLLARLPRDQDDDVNDGGIPPRFTTSVTTVVQTLDILGKTLVQTEVVTVLLPVTAASSSSASQSSTSVPTPSSTSASSTSISSSSSNTSTSSSSSSSETSAGPVATPPSAAPIVSPTAQATQSSFQAVIPTSSSSSDAAPTSLDASASSASTKSGGLSGGAIGGIIVVIVLAALAILIFIVRKTLLRKRQNRRNTWGAGVYPKLNFQDEIREKPIVESATSTISPPPVPAKSVMPLAVSIPAPPMSYNNPAPPPMTAMQQTSSPTLKPGAGAASVALTPAAGAFAYVSCTFIPNLPDELSISMGETVRVVNEYDDGWALCANSHNEQGVVPLECLNRGSAQTQAYGQYLGQGTGDWRMSRRASSLYAQNRSPLRY
ncbi:hypothetical protein EW026_g2582 [Hermanssonia centrifuga]|uniref:SH3 domain-containing protein n=1 Tax=Hermanssonia centrifuga TaxID=98765 RepID=A0A4S4KMS7_9APHY|nr:hypothetical protein EW026_g2582 [Hermanssonia centrifuga]